MREREREAQREIERDRKREINRVKKRGRKIRDNDLINYVNIVRNQVYL